MRNWESAKPDVPVPSEFSRNPWIYFLACSCLNLLNLFINERTVWKENDFLKLKQIVSLVWKRHNLMWRVNHNQKGGSGSQLANPDPRIVNPFLTITPERLSYTSAVSAINKLESPAAAIKSRENMFFHGSKTSQRPYSTADNITNGSNTLWRP